MLVDDDDSFSVRGLFWKIGFFALAREVKLICTHEPRSEGKFVRNNCSDEAIRDMWDKIVMRADNVDGMGLDCTHRETVNECIVRGAVGINKSDTRRKEIMNRINFVWAEYVLFVCGTVHSILFSTLSQVAKFVTFRMSKSDIRTSARNINKQINAQRRHLRKSKCTSYRHSPKNVTV